ncbi:anti-sigma factor antagonist [Saccharothrix syringae]|uniref:anti-sigma factor antagonist n=1 Tax=Saccharothrix syringae TaxID=103733 RepID=UPI00068A05B8|nr:anti-sigma factor antagonist [Saccharothrix syringae]
MVAHFDRPFRVEREVHGYAIVVRVVGEVDSSTAAELGRATAVALALATPPAPVVVDLSDVDFISAAGLNQLQRDHGAASAAGVELRVVARHRHVLRPFEVTGLDRDLRPAATLAEALRVRATDARRAVLRG